MELGLKVFCPIRGFDFPVNHLADREMNASRCIVISCWGFANSVCVWRKNKNSRRPGQKTTFYMFGV